jgi:DNA-binding transcriptional MerR regulator
MSSRSYLSIGDVLTLLRQEFPDVTISKIRFLESQGLVNPERTPSGYRKFYEHDVERLRWVLRQQREHFLPLKVIKDRLDDEGGATTDAPVAAGSPAVEEPVLVGQRASNEGAGAHGTGGSRHRRLDEPPAAHGTGPTLPGIESGTVGTNGAPAAEDVAADPTRAATPDKAPSRTPAARRAPQAASTATGAADEPAPPRSPKDDAVGRGGAAPAAPAAPADGEPGPEPRRPRSGTASTPSAATESGPVTPAGRASGPPAAGADPSSGPGTAAATPVPNHPEPSAALAAAGAAAGPGKGSRAPSSLSGAGSELPVPPRASMSLDELSAASGLEVSALEDLADFGLLVGTRVAGQLYFDGEGLAVAKLAAGFARFGVEPRHLRLYKNAADREAGFVEQIVTPLVRQRNPEARARAHETVDELASLGQQLKASLLRSALGPLLDG